MHCGNAISSSEDAILARQSGKNFDRLVRVVAITQFVGVRKKAQERNGCNGVAGRSGRVLKWLAARAQYAECFVLPASGLLGVEEAARNGIEKTVHHRIRNAPREVEVAEVGGGFIRVQAGDRSECIIVEQARNLAPAGLRIRI